MEPCGYQSRNVSHIYKQISADLLRNIGKQIKTDLTRISGSPCHDQLRLTFPRNRPDLVIIKKSILIDIIWYKMI